MASAVPTVKERTDGELYKRTCVDGTPDGSYACEGSGIVSLVVSSCLRWNLIEKFSSYVLADF